MTRDTTLGILISPLTAEHYQLRSLVTQSMCKTVHKQNSPIWRYNRTRSIVPFEDRLREAETFFIGHYGSLQVIGLIEFCHNESENKIVVRPRMTQRGREVLEYLNKGYVFNSSYNCQSLPATREYWEEILSRNDIISTEMLTMIAKLPIAQFLQLHNSALHRKMRSTVDDRGNLVLPD